MLNNIKENITKASQKVEVTILTNKAISTMLLLMVIMVVVATPVYAAPQVGQNSATYIFEQVSWAVLVGGILLAVKSFTKGNTARAAIWVGVAGILFVLCKNPTKLDTFGKWFFEITGL